MKLSKTGVWLLVCAGAVSACAAEETGDESATEEPDASTDETVTPTPEAGSDTTEEPATDLDAGTESDTDLPEPVDASTATDEPDAATGEDPADSSTGFDPNASEGGVDITEPDAGPTFSVSGQLKVSNALFADSDGPNPDNARLVNDSIATDGNTDQSQSISSPSTVGGYLGLLPVLDAQGDPTEETLADNRDAYRVSLAAGQTVTLFVAEPPDDSAPVADLDLFLINTADGLIADDSQGVGDKEQVTADESGDYWIVIERYQDEEDEADDAAQAVYSMAVGIAQSNATQMSVASMKLSSQWEAVPGEAIVQFGFGPQSAEVAAVVTANDESDVTGFQRVQLNGVARGGFSAQGREGLSATLKGIKRLRKLGLKGASPNYVFKHFAVPPGDDPLMSSQWHYDQIDVGEAWAQSDQTAAGQRGQGVVVAVIDTGVAVNHPDFANADGTSQLTSDGFDMISDPEVAADGDGRDANPDDPGDARTPGDSSFHGSHCAGTVAAATNNGEGGGGVAPLARIMPIRALGRGGGTLEDIRQAVLYAAGVENTSGELPDEPADIISMSLGGPGTSEAMAAAVAQARAAGAIVIAAAGNSNAPAEFFSPAGEQGVVTVMATDFNRDKAFYSNFGEGNSVIELAAPGGDTGADENLDGQPDGVVSMVFKNEGRTQYAAYQGTSMACPHVAGVAALMKSVWPEMGPAEFDAALGEIVVDLGDTGRDPIFGFGLVNANLAVGHALAQAGEDVLGEPVLSVSSSVLDFGSSITSLPLALGNTGQGDLEITSVTASATWVEVTPGGLGTNTVTVQPNELVPGVNTATVTVVSNGGTEVITVRAFLGEEPTGGNLGIAYVLLVDPTTGQVAPGGQAAAFPDEGYAFNIPDVPPGKYYLVAGTDLRNSLFVGNDGDAYGAFPLAQDPVLICRFVENDPECPVTTQAEQDDPNLSNVTIPIEYLLDVGARQVEEQAVKPEGYSPKALSFSTAPMRVRRK